LKSQIIFLLNII